MDKTTKEKQIPIVSDKEKNVLKFESMRDYVGKQVVSKSGEQIGTIVDVLFTDKGVKGIVVASGPFSRFYVDLSFFSTISDKAMLTINPVILLVGKEVFDSDGKKLGRVSTIKRKGNSNDLEAVVVKKRIYSKGIQIPASDIDVMKKNIILNTTYK